MIAALFAIFSGVGIIVKFIKSFLVKYVGFAAILGFQFAITASTIAFVLGFYAFIITSLVTAYNFGVSTAQYVSTGGGGQSQILSCFMSMLDLVGVTGALNNAYTMFFASLSTIALFHLMKFTYWAVRQIGNELFKLGVLLGQALS
ncbi:hypothetical protein [Sulfurimonas sp.]|uniref:hypothetical protein n=1 Tax=Sulfurimonas sp. TaxID=2022749 RepID=UPI003D11EA10